MGQIRTKAKAWAELTPVERVIRTFGYARAGALVMLTTDGVKKWNRPRSKGGGGGLVPAVYQKRYLDQAAAEGLALTAADFIADPRQ